jgi:predicted ATPase
LLSTTEQQALRDLSVFRGGFNRAAAEQVARTSLVLLSSLTAKSLVRRSDTDRYDLHELIRQYAESHLQSAPIEYDAVRDRHSLFYFELLHERQALIQSAQQPAVVKELTLEIDNVRWAWAWAAAHQKYAEITAALDCLWTFYDIRGWFQEAVEQTELIINSLQNGAGPSSHPIDLGHSERFLGWFCFRRGQYRQARAVLEQSLTHLRSIGDPAQLPAALISCAVVTYRMGDPQVALQLNDEALTITKAYRDDWLAAWAYSLHGIIHSILATTAKRMTTCPPE